MSQRSFSLGAAAAVVAVLLAVSTGAAQWSGVVYPAGFYGYVPGYAAADFYGGTWGYRHSWDLYAYGFHDYGLNNYGSAPTTVRYSDYYPTEEWSPSPPWNGADVEVWVPADAALWFDGVPSEQTGARRGFVTPPLTPGQDYTYQVRARWTEDGRTVNRTKTIHVRANGRTEVDMTRPDSGDGKGAP
jgi:uncharacterized protein (TIGR03000 family)